MLAGVILGGAYLYKYFAFQVSRVHFVTRALCVFSTAFRVLKRGAERLSKPNSLAALFFIFGKLQPFYRQSARPVLSAEEGRTKLANKKE